MHIVLRAPKMRSDVKFPIAHNQRPIIKKVILSSQTVRKRRISVTTFVWQRKDSQSSKYLLCKHNVFVVKSAKNSIPKITCQIENS